MKWFAFLFLGLGLSTSLVRANDFPKFFEKDAPVLSERAQQWCEKASKHRTVQRLRVARVPQTT